MTDQTLYPKESKELSTALSLHQTKRKKTERKKCRLMEHLDLKLDLLTSADAEICSVT